MMSIITNFPISVNTNISMTHLSCAPNHLLNIPANLEHFHPLAKHVALESSNENASMISIYFHYVIQTPLMSLSETRKVVKTPTNPFETDFNDEGHVPKEII